MSTKESLSEDDMLMAVLFETPTRYRCWDLDARRRETDNNEKLVMQRGMEERKMVNSNNRKWKEGLFGKERIG
jgi:hypothetical protein